MDRYIRLRDLRVNRERELVRPRSASRAPTLACSRKDPSPDRVSLGGRSACPSAEARRTPAESAKVRGAGGAVERQAHAPSDGVLLRDPGAAPAALTVGRLPSPASSACNTSHEPAAQSTRTTGNTAGPTPSRLARTAAPSSTPTRPNALDGRSRLGARERGLGSGAAPAVGADLSPSRRCSIRMRSAARRWNGSPSARRRYRCPARPRRG